MNKINDLAQIPYVAHEYRMFKAYQRELRLKIALVSTNLAWLIALAVIAMR